MVTGLMTATLACFGCGHAGYSAAIIDVAPSYAGQLFGISNTFGTVAGIVGNVLTGWLWHWTGSLGTVFATCVALNVCGAVVYCLFGTTDPFKVLEHAEEDAQADDTCRR